MPTRLYALAISSCFFLVLMVAGGIDGMHRLQTNLTAALQEQTNASEQSGGNVEAIAHMAEENSAASGGVAQAAHKLDSWRRRCTIRR